MPYYRSTYACSTGILAAFEHTITDLPAAEIEDYQLPEVGIDPDLFTLPIRSNRADDNLVCWEAVPVTRSRCSRFRRQQNPAAQVAHRW